MTEETCGECQKQFETFYNNKSYCLGCSIKHLLKAYPEEAIEEIDPAIREHLEKFKPSLNRMTGVMYH